MTETMLLTALNEKIDRLTAVVERLITEHRAEETYLTTEEACAKYKVSATTLFQRKREGRIESWQDGRILRWPETELRKLYKIR
jgi:excisionase family DNA binding protein